MRVLIPLLDDDVAPCFEVASRFAIAVIENDDVISIKTIVYESPEGYNRIRLLRVHDIDMLICNGIKSHFYDMVVASGIAVIKDVTGSVKSVLARLLSGELVADLPIADEALSETRCAPHAELVDWAKKLFKENGYTVSSISAPDYLLIDFVAEIQCPVCGRPVRVAVCCGSHTYRPIQEIIEFHHSSQTGFNARAYVCLADQAIVDYCREYGIELLNPKDSERYTRHRQADKLPILSGVVTEHEKASLMGDSRSS